MTVVKVNITATTTRLIHSHRQTDTRRVRNIKLAGKVSRTGQKRKIVRQQSEGVESKTLRLTGSGHGERAPGNAGRGHLPDSTGMSDAQIGTDAKGQDLRPVSRGRGKGRGYHAGPRCQARSVAVRAERPGSGLRT